MPMLKPLDTRLTEVELLIWKICRQHYRTFPPRVWAAIDLEDCVQMVYLTLVKQDHRYNGGRAKYSTFVYRIAHNEMNSLREAWNAKKRQETPLSLDLPASLTDPEGAPLEELVAHKDSPAPGSDLLQDSVLAAWYGPNSPEGHWVR